MSLPSEIRVLTVRQPWAWAIIHGGKDVENRTRNIAGDYRGPVAIHAGLQGASFDSRHPDLWPFDERHITGAIIGVVDLVGVHYNGTHSERWDTQQERNTTCSPWAEHGDVWHLQLANARPIDPIPYRGGLGLRRITDPELISQLLTPVSGDAITTTLKGNRQ